MKKLLFIFIAILLAILTVKFLDLFNFSKSKAIPKANQEIAEVKIGLVAGLSGIADNTYIYPFQDIDLPGRAVASQYLEGLVALDQDFKIQPLLAKRWENLDDYTWRFYLQEGVTFSDGSLFDASDVKFTIETILKNPKWENSKYIQTIKEVKIISPYVVDLVTKSVDRSLVNSLWNVFILSHKSFDTASPKSGRIGTGQYLLSDETKDGYVVLERNEKYWGRKPAVKRVIYKTIEDDKQRYKAFINKEVDLIEYAPLDKLAEEKNSGINQVLVQPDLYVWYVGFNTQRNPFKDVRVRQAVYYAINIDELIQNTYQGFAEGQSQLVTKFVFGYNPNIKRFPFDPIKAKQLLTEAGYPDGFKVNLDVRHPRIATYAKEVARQLNKIGIKTTVTVRRKEVTSAEDRAKFEAGDTSMYMTATGIEGGGDVQSVLAAFLHSVTPDNKYGSENKGHYDNPKVDGLIEKAADEKDRKVKQTLMQEAMRVAVMEDTGFVPLNVDGVAYLVNKNLAWKPRADNQIRASEISAQFND